MTQLSFTAYCLLASALLAAIVMVAFDRVRPYWKRLSVNSRIYILVSMMITSVIAFNYVFWNESLMTLAIASFMIADVYLLFCLITFKAED